MRKLFLIVLFSLICLSYQQRYFLSYDLYQSGGRISNTFWRLGRCFTIDRMFLNNPIIRTGSPIIPTTSTISPDQFYQPGSFVKFFCGGANGQTGYICNYPTLGDCIGDVKEKELCYEFQYTGFSHYCVYDYTPYVNKVTGDNLPDLSYTPYPIGPASMTTYKYDASVNTSFAGQCDSKKCDSQVNYVIYTQDPDKTCQNSPATTIDDFFVAQTRCLPLPTNTVQPTAAPTPATKITPEIRLYKGNCSNDLNIYRTYQDLDCIDADTTLKNYFKALPTTAVPAPKLINFKSWRYNSTAKKTYFYGTDACSGKAVASFGSTAVKCTKLTPTVVLNGNKILNYHIKIN